MAEIVVAMLRFLLVLGIGVYFFLPVVRSEDTGAGFFKLASAVSFFSVLGFLLLSLTPFYEIPNFDKVVTFVLLGTIGITYLTKLDVTTKADRMLRLIFLGASTTLVLDLNRVVILNKLFAFYDFASIGYIGSLVFAMILGHYYLVVPKLSEKPLLILHSTFWIFMLFKIGLSTYALSQWELDLSAHMLDAIFIAMRFLWGYLSLLILSFFSFKLSRMRSTQSATGLLYVMVFFMLVGEIIGYYYFGNKGILL